MDWQLGTLAEAFSPLYRARVREGRSAAEVEPMRVRSAQAFTLLDGALDDAPFLAGAQLTLAEIALGPLVYRWLVLPLERPDLPRLASHESPKNHHHPVCFLRERVNTRRRIAGTRTPAATRGRRAGT